MQKVLTVGVLFGILVKMTQIIGDNNSVLEDKGDL